MKKFTKFCIGVGCVAGLFYYAINQLVKEDEFSDSTKENLDDVVKSAKNIGESVKRTYTSLGDKKKFENNTKKLGNDVKNIYDSSISLVKDASNDMYTYYKDKITNNDKKNLNKNFNNDKKKSHKKNKNSKKHSKQNNNAPTHNQTSGNKKKK